MSFDAEEMARLQAAWKAQAGGGEAEPPDPDRLWAAVAGELTPEERQQLVEQTAGSPELAEDWRLVEHVYRESGEAGEVVPMRAPAARRYGWLAAAAAVVAAVGLWQVPRWLEPDPPVFREPPKEAIRSLIPEDESLPRERCVLRWSGPEGAVYDLSVTTEELEPVASVRGLDLAEYQVPAEDLRQLPAGSRLLWRVEAAAPGGRRSSATFFLRLK